MKKELPNKNKIKLMKKFFIKHRGWALFFFSLNSLIFIKQILFNQVKIISLVLYLLVGTYFLWQASDLNKKIKSLDRFEIYSQLKTTEEHLVSLRGTHNGK